MWGPPSEEYKELHGSTVVQERKFDKKIRNRVAFAPDYADSYAIFSVLEKTDTKLRIKQTHYTRNAPYTDSFEVWVLWDVLTPDPQSNQVVIRKVYKIKWFSKPLVWRIIRNAITKGVNA